MTSAQTPSPSPASPPPTGGEKPEKSYSAPALIAALVILAVALVMPVPDGWSAEAVRAAGLVLATVLMLATGGLPLGVTAVGFMTLGILLGIQPPSVIFSGFHSGALWLVFAGLVIGVSVHHTGLGARFAEFMLARIGRSYFTVLAGIAAVALALAFVMPSAMGRVVLLIPLVMKMADGLGFEHGSKGRAGMALVTGLVSFLPGGTILPSLLPGMILAGAAETLYGEVFTFAGYLWINFPVMGVLRTVLIVAVAWWLFHERPKGEAGLKAERAPLSGAEWRLTLILGVALALWVSDSVHGIHPAWVGLGAAFLMLLPGAGLVPPKTVDTKLDYSSVFYPAAVIGMGATIAGTGLSDRFGEAVLALLPGAEAPTWLSFSTLSATSAALAMVSTNPAVPAVMSPLAGDIASQLDMPVATVLMAQVFGFSNVVLPYQASPVFVSMALAGVSLAHGAKMTLTMTFLSLVVLLPLEYVWWQWLGMF